MTLKKDIINSFPGKMENRQAFIIQFIMEMARKGVKPPSKEKIEETIDSLIKEGSFEAKGNLLILKAKKKKVIDIDEEDDVVDILETQIVSGNFDEYESMILGAFQGKYENKLAIIMNATISAASSGNHAPPKEKLESAIESLKEKKVLTEKGAMLIKNSR
ncbi:MAG: hypothetical protein ACTSR2_14595 [Candidatus Hodarchaeales archaeon]